MAIQKMLLSSITLAVVTDEVFAFDSGGGLEPGSPLDGFFSELAKDSGLTKEKLLAYASPRGDKAKLGAYIQKMLQLNGAIKAAV
jgi:hypothetical protein